MPYRRLPNTDTKRLRAMKIALDKAEELPVFKLPFSMGIIQRIKTLNPNFEKHIILQRESLKLQVEKQKEYSDLYKKAKTYVSHFIQVMSMAVIRRELRPDIYKFYGFTKQTVKVPSFKNENELLEIGHNLIAGEKERMLHGGNPITNPTIALVNVHFEKFVSTRRYQKQLQENYQRCTNDISVLRPEVDKIIQLLWNEIESHFSKLPDDEKREMSSIFGVEYVFRRGERPEEETDKENTKQEEEVIDDNNQKEDDSQLQYSISF